MFAVKSLHFKQHARALHSILYRSWELTLTLTVKWKCTNSSLIGNMFLSLVEQELLPQDCTLGDETMHAISLASPTRIERLRVGVCLLRYKMVSEQLKRTTRYYSTTWRMWAAMAIQLAWRRFKARRSKFYSGPLNFARLHDGSSGLDAVQQDRLRMYTAMMTCRKPADNWGSEISSCAEN